MHTSPVKNTGGKAKSKYPWYKLANKGGKPGFEIGKIYREEEIVEPLFASLLTYTWERGVINFSTGKVSCSSFDGKVPADHIKEPFCQRIDANQYKQQLINNNMKPENAEKMVAQHAPNGKLSICGQESGLWLNDSCPYAQRRQSPRHRRI